MISSSLSCVFSARFCTTFVVLDELVSTIDTGNLSSKNLMIEARRSAYVPSDLPVNTTASPNSVSSMVDFNARIFASSSILLAHACSALLPLYSVLGLVDVSPRMLTRCVTLEYATDLSASFLGSKWLAICFHASNPDLPGRHTLFFAVYFLRTRRS